MPPLLSQDRFAQLIGKETKTIRSWVTTRAIPTVKVGGSRMVNIEQLRQDLLAGKRSFVAGDYKFNN
ncbi:MAG: hypothetical protein KDI24_05830 [Pseudomonadales bacterium]|nr:hypothetical protein [Pseudomonadales bacterium]MCP5172625.1 hypothetical protein [Pseudomonadales bacterium]MCP5302099.1 hypothetical protein [Pseudomonadales bacterium]